METIWDHNPTKEELTKIFGRSERIHILDGAGENTHLACLAWLFQVRGDERKAQQYAQRISDPDYRLAILFSLQKLS